MKITMVQFHTSENIQDNIHRMEEILLHCQADLIVLPELWLCPFQNDRIQEAKQWQEKAKEMLQSCAKSKHVWIVGGSIPYENQNVCFVFDRMGQEVCHYAKTHLLEVHANSTYKERDVFIPGDAFCTFDSEFGKIGILICYDIRFPEMARILSEKGIRILLIPAAFNQQVGEVHWKPLLQTRAMENQIFVVGVNPEYTYGQYQAYGHSLVIDPFGRILLEAKDEVETIDIDVSYVEKIRRRMPFWSIRRTDLYTIEEKNNERN